MSADTSTEPVAAGPASDTTAAEGTLPVLGRDTTAAEATPPVPGSDTPAAEATPPVPGSDTPAAEATPPVPGSDTPAAEATPPVPGSDTPAAEATPPVPGSDTPAAEATPPVPGSDTTATEEPRASAGAQDTAGSGAAGFRRVLVLGATSEIAVAIVLELATGEPCEVALAARDQQRLGDVAQRLRGAGCTRVQTLALEATDTGSHRAAITRGIELLGGECDLVLLAVGLLGERGGLPDDPRGAVEVLEVNVVGCGSLLLESARALRAQGRGTIVVLSSVAAERPRASSAVYCASKAGLDALAQGLADALAPTGVRVLVVRPGFVATRMTRGLPVPPLSTDPESVARATVRGLRRGAHTVWAPTALRWVMALVRLLPRPLFRRLPL